PLQRFGRVVGIEHFEQILPELRRSGVADEVSFAGGFGEVHLERGKVDRPRCYGRREHACRLTKGFRERLRTHERLRRFCGSSRKQSGEINFSAVEQTGERELALQASDSEL